MYKSGEDYLEAILVVENEKGKVRSIDIGRQLGVSRPSVNRAVNVLASQGYLEHETYGNVVLTDKGRRYAQRVYGRHTALARYLHEILGVSQEISVRDACLIEHDVSPETMDRIKEHLQAFDAQNKGSKG
ncbi:MAG: metal-dependent transcriptional regulator [Spirochaetia bacterium]|jgi:Mn-dependent DtxR family transcriptional regulator|nr:metal-dependent transcriptional regulator [Spirochaetia bacterium]